MARAIRQATVAVECDGCGTTFGMPAREHARHMAERSDWTCPSCGGRRHFLAPRRHLAALLIDVKDVALRAAAAAQKTSRAASAVQLREGVALGAIALEETEAKLARLTRELQEVAALLYDA